MEPIVFTGCFFAGWEFLKIFIWRLSKFTSNDNLVWKFALTPWLLSIWISQRIPIDAEILAFSEHHSPKMWIFFFFIFDGRTISWSKGLFFVTPPPNLKQADIFSSGILDSHIFAGLQWRPILCMLQDSQNSWFSTITTSSSSSRKNQLLRNSLWAFIHTKVPEKVQTHVHVQIESSFPVLGS